MSSIVIDKPRSNILTTPGDNKNSSSLSQTEQDVLQKDTFATERLFQVPKRDNIGQALPSGMPMPKSGAQRAAIAEKIASSVAAQIFAHDHAELMKTQPQRLVQNELKMDCVAVGISHQGDTVTVAANVKTRSQATKKRTKYSGFGLQEHHEPIIVQTVRTVAPETAHAKIEIITLVKAPTSAAENAAPHAEMQILARQTKKSASKTVIGTSKPPCEPCRNELAQQQVSNQSEPGSSNAKPKNGQEPAQISVKKKTARARKSVQVHHNLGQGSVKARVKEAFTPVTKKPPATKKKLAKQHLKPGGPFSAGTFLESIINDCDRKPGAYTRKLITEAGTYKTRCSTGVVARAVTAEVTAHASVASATARGPGAVAGAHAGAGGVAAYATAEVARAEASVAGITVGVGLNANTGASIGIDGIEASILGFGMSIGPRMSIKTPVGDVSCVIM